MVQFYTFACGCLIFPISFIKETVFSPWHSIGSFALNELAIHVRVYSQAHNSVSLIYVPIVLIIIALCYSFKMGSIKPPALFFFLKIIFIIWCFFGFIHILGVFPDDKVIKNLPANAEDARDAGSIPGLGSSPGAGNGNLLQYSCLENPMERGAWRATVHRVAKSWT